MPRTPEWLQLGRAKLNALGHLIESEHDLYLMRCRDRHGALCTVVSMRNEDSGEMVPLFRFFEEMEASAELTIDPENDLKKGDQHGRSR